MSNDAIGRLARCGGAQWSRSIVWSPDSRFVAFDATGVIKKVGLDGGAPQSTCAVPAIAVGGSWNRDGEILLGNPMGGLVRCSASSSRTTVATVPDEPGQEGDLFPSFLSDGRHFVYLRFSRTKPETSGIYVGELGAASPGVRRRLITTGFPDPHFQLTWFDRRGREIGRVGSPARFSDLALSPDGDRALVATQAPQGTATDELWLFALSQTAIPRRVTFGPELERGPVWSTNDRVVLGSAGGASGVYQQTVGGNRRLLFQSGMPERPTSITSDGRMLLYTTPAGPATGGEVWVHIATGASTSTRPFLQGERGQWQAQFSPDRRWVAYVSNEDGPNDVFVTGFQHDSVAASVVRGESLRLSEGGGVAPRWRREGRELFYLTPDGWVMSIAADTERTFRPGTAKRLFEVPGVMPAWGVSPSGDRFLFAVPLSRPSPFNVVQNWQAVLPK